MRQKGPPCHGWNNFQRWNLCFQWGFSNSIWGIFINTRRCRGDTGLALRLSEHSEDTWRADKLSLNIFILLNICGGGGTLWPGQTQQHRAAQHSAGGRPADLQCSLLTTPRVDGVEVGTHFCQRFYDYTLHPVSYKSDQIGTYNPAVLHVDMCPGWWLLAGLVQWPGWCCCAALCTTQPAHTRQGTLHCCPHHCSDAVQTINFTIMILHGTHCCTVWSGLCLLVTLVTSAVVESVEAQRPPLPAWQHQCQCGGGEHRPPLATSPPQLGPAVRNTKTSARERLMILVAGAGRP